VAVDLALPAFLSSCNGASDLTLRLLPSRIHEVSGNLDPVCTAACLEWKNRYDVTEPVPVKASVQKAWDAPVVSLKREEVLSSAQDQVGRSQLLAATAPHSGDFLHAYPAHRLERGSMTPHFELPSLCVLEPKFVHHTHAFVVSLSTALVCTALLVVSPQVAT
jgi:hypothetical protein